MKSKAIVKMLIGLGLPPKEVNYCVVTTSRVEWVWKFDGPTCRISRNSLSSHNSTVW